MNSARRKLLTLSIMAGYGFVSVLGYGLHWFVPQHGHHHGLQVVCTAPHDAEHVDHNRSHTGVAHHHHGHHHQGLTSESPQGTDQTAVALTASGCGAHAHLCEICAFLFHSRAEPTQWATAVVSQALIVGGVLAPIQRLTSATSLSPHSPRGPPAHAS